MTNPGNAIGTNAAFGGRTSVNAFNDGLAGYTRGILSGWACAPNSGLTVALGGSGTVRDVAIAEDNAGNKNTINNISNSPVSVTMSAAPASNSRIDLIVAYVDNPSNGTATATDNPGACGIIPVAGTAAASPVAPNESAIRSAITADGANGAAAYYVVLAKITIASGTTDITSNMIEAGPMAILELVRMKTFVPDYDGDYVDIRNSLPYTATSKCFVRIGTSGNVIVRINSRQVITNENAGFCWFELAVGDVLSLNPGTQTENLTTLLFQGRWV